MHTYRFNDSYDDNYELGPVPVPVPPRPDTDIYRIESLNIELGGRIGIFSGPLLNSRWVELYSRLGYDLLAYKTVRSEAWPSHDWPNCAYIEAREQLPVRGSDRPPFLVATPTWPDNVTQVSMTNSYGMPSRPPALWGPDVGRALASLGEAQALIVSVVGRDIADYVNTARMARETGAHAVEINLSCPNVVTQEGSIYTDCALSQSLCREVKAALGPTPLIIKVGFIEDNAALHALLEAVATNVQGVSGINTVPLEIRSGSGEPLLGANRRVAGVCGDAIRACGLDFAERLCDWRETHGAEFAVLAGGGIMLPAHVDEYLALGVDVAMLATAAMVNPLLAYDYYSQS